MKHEGACTSFERLDRELLDIRRRVSLSYLFSWNYAAKLGPRPLFSPEYAPPMPPADRITGWEIGALVLSLCMLFASCKEEKDSAPEIAGPCPGPRRPAVRVLGAQELQDGSFVIMLTKEGF